MAPYTVGWVYNLNDPNATTSAGSLIGIAVSFAVIATLAVALRLYVRLGKQKNRLHFDDYAVLATWFLCVAHSGIVVYQTRWGQALSPQAFPPQNITPFFKVQYAGGITYTVSLVGFKIALLACYYRVGSFVRNFRYVLYAVGAMIIVNQLVLTLVLAFACRPVRKFWDVQIEGECIDNVAAYFALGGTNIFFDVVIIVLPMPIIAKLKLPLRKKLGLAAMVAIGLFITVTQIFRMITVSRLKAPNDSASTISWSIVEINLGVLVACIPTYAPLIAAAREKMSTNSRKAGYTPEYASWQQRVGQKQKSTSKNGPSDNDSEEAMVETRNGIHMSTAWTQVVEERGKV